MTIHSTAVVHPQARIGEAVEIGPYCIVGADVGLGRGCRLHPHVVVEGPTQVGEACEFFPFASVGQIPQDLKFKGECSFVEIGHHNIFREYVTVHRGTQGGGLYTRIGNHNLLMANAHVAHDCQIGSHVILANGATLAGHVIIEDYATVGAYTGVHQFCRIGEHAFIGGFSVITQDVAPFSLIVSERETKHYGVNKVGLERRGFSPEKIKKLEHAFRTLLRSKRNLSDAVAAIKNELRGSDEVERLVAFIEKSERGIIRR